MRSITILVMLCSVARAEPSHGIAGFVFAADTKRPLEGATVMTTSGDIAVTDERGSFTLSVGETQEVSVELAGYASRTVTVAGESLRIELTRAASDEVIEVTSKAPSQTKPVTYKLSTEEITTLPGAGNDALRAAQILPGASRIPFGFGGLVLRGTAPADSQVFLDGVEVPLAFHFGGLTSFIPSRMLSDLSLSSGGFESEFGRTQGGVVNLTTREPRTDRWRVGGTMGVLDSSLVAEGPVANGGILLGVRHSYFDAVVDPFLRNEIPLPSYWDAQLKGSFGDPRKGGRFTPLLVFSYDHIANHPATTVDAPALSITSMFARASVAYLKQWGPLTLRAQPWVGMNRLSFSSIEEGRTETLERPEFPAGARVDITRDTNWGHVRGGIDASGGYLSRTKNEGSHSISWANIAAWGETRLKLGERLSIKPGLRVERYGLTDETVVDPRLNLEQKLTDRVTLRQSLGRFHQPPATGDLDPDGGNPRLDSSYFDQASVGVDTAITENASASVSGFYGHGWNLGVPTGQMNLGGLSSTFDLLLQKQLGFPIDRTNIGRGRTYGLEVMVKAHFDRFFGMVGYTLSKSQRTDDPEMTTGWRPFELDQRHNLNAAGSVDLGHGFRAGGRLRLVSGSPYSPAPDRPWTGTLPTFFALDVRADKQWRRKWGDLNLFLDIQNVTNRHNVEGMEVDEKGVMNTTSGLPIMPFIGLELVPR